MSKTQFNNKNIENELENGLELENNEEIEEVEEVDEIDDNEETIDLVDEIKIVDDEVEELDLKNIINNSIFEERKLNTIFSPQLEIFMPFASKVDPSRANMAAKQQTQPIIHNNCERPMVIDKEYRKITYINSPFLERAEDDGFIVYNNNDILIIYYKNMQKMFIRHIPEIKKMVNNSLQLKYKINEKEFKKGDILWDYTNIDVTNDMPRIGYRARTLFMQWFGYNADDAVIVSESFAKKARIQNSEKVYIPITKKWKYFRTLVKDGEDCFLPDVGQVIDQEELIAYDLIDTTNHFTSEIVNLSKDKSKFYTKKIDGIKDGKITAIKIHLFNIMDETINNLWQVDNDEYYHQIEEKFNKLNELYFYNKGLIQEIKEKFMEQLKIKDDIFEAYVRLGVSEDKAREFAQSQFNQYFAMEDIFKHYDMFLNKNFNISGKELDFLIEIDIMTDNRSTRGDKFTNLFAGKAVTSMIIPDELMPTSDDGKPIDVIFNTLGIPGRNNWGTIFEALISKIIDDVEDLVNENPDNLKDELLERIEFINEKLIKNDDIEYYNTVKELIQNMKNNEELFNEFVNDIKKGFYLYFSNFSKITYNELYKIAEEYSKKFNINIGKNNVKISQEFMEWIRNKWNFKLPFMNTNERVIEATVATNYFLKLYHTSYSKYNSVDFTSSYSKITGQPTRGRKRGGGQHLSWQSTAALLARKENNAILKEFYSIKSDVIDEKQTFILKYLRDGKYHLKDKYNSVTKKTVNNALKIFGMKFDDED